MYVTTYTHTHIYIYTHVHICKVSPRASKEFVFRSHASTHKGYGRWMPGYLVGEKKIHR